MNAVEFTRSSPRGDVYALTLENERLREQIAVLKAERAVEAWEVFYMKTVRRWGLTESEASVLDVLWRRRDGVARKEAIHGRLYGDKADADAAGYKIVDVFVCKLRKKLGFDAIMTIWGGGYSLTPEGIAAVEEGLSAALPEPAPVLKRKALNYVYLRILDVMGDAGRPISSGEVERIAKCKSAASTHIHRLCDMGLAEQAGWGVPSPRNGRTPALYRLTDRGRRRYEARKVES